MRRLLSTAGPSLALTALLLLPLPASGQEGGGRPETAADSVAEAARRARALATADSVRANFGRRPPGEPPDGALLDVLEAPADLALAPFRLLLDGVVQAGEAVTDAVPPGEVVARVRAVEDWGLVPEVGSIGPRSGEALTLRMERYPPLFVEAGQSLRGSRRAAVGAELGAAREVDDDPERIELDETGRRFWARGAYAYEYHDEPHFWGIGIATPDSNESDFLWERHLVTVEGRMLLSPSVRLGAVAGFEDNRSAGDGRDDGKPPVSSTFDPTLLFGLADHTHLARAGVSATLDRTWWEGIQRRGYLLAGGVTAYEGVAGTDTDFHRFEAEAHAYLPFTSRHEVAFRALGEVNRGESRRDIPFFHLAALGSTHGLRGFPTHRFRDRDLAALMTEYRYEIWRDEPAGAEAFLFFDVGGVADALDELGAFETSWGVGLRLIDERDLMGMSYLAFSDEETRVALKFGWPF